MVLYIIKLIIQSFDESKEIIWGQTRAFSMSLYEFFLFLHKKPMQKKLRLRNIFRGSWPLGVPAFNIATVYTKSVASLF